MSKQETTIVLELTRDEALGLVQLLAHTGGIRGYSIYSELLDVLGGGPIGADNRKRTEAQNEARNKFPTLAGLGRF
jgi:hypothetical protein